MAEKASKGGKPSIMVTIQGHEVALYFSDEPNTQLALKVKQALLGTYLTAKE